MEGRISSDTIWTKANSPYIVTSTIEVYGDEANAATLTIEPGVEIRFDLSTVQQQGLHIGNGSNKGILRAIGTEEEKIIFTAKLSKN